MTTGTKVLFGALAFLPLLFIILIEVQLFSAMPMRSGGPDIDTLFRPGHEQELTKIALLFALATLATMVALVAFIVHLFRNKTILDNQRIVWLLVLLFAGSIGQLIYFFKFIVKSKPSAAPASTTAKGDFWNT